jgi:hypothetical protein
MNHCCACLRATQGSFSNFVRRQGQGGMFPAAAPGAVGRDGNQGFPIVHGSELVLVEFTGIRFFQSGQDIRH